MTDIPPAVLIAAAAAWLAVGGFCIGYVAGKLLSDNMKIKISFSFKWFDMWIGFYYDRVSGTLFFCPLPCCVFRVWRQFKDHGEKW